MFCIIVNALIAVMVIGMLNALSVQTATATAVEEKEKSEYLADSGIQHAMERLERTPGWSGQIRWEGSGTTLPGDSGFGKYEVSVNKDTDGRITISSRGVFGDARTTRMVVSGGGG